MLDLAGIHVGGDVPHMSLPNVILWWGPGFWMESILQRISVHAPRPTVRPEQIAIQGGLRQPDGSLILYGLIDAFNSYQLVARLDREGNPDPTFRPADFGQFANDIRPLPDGTALYDSPRRGGGLDIDQISADGSIRRIGTIFYEGEIGEAKAHIDMKAKVFPFPLATRYDKVLRVSPDGKVDEPFNTEAAKTVHELSADLGGLRRVTVDREGNILEVFSRGICRLDPTGRLMPPGVTKFDPARISAPTAYDPNGIAVGPDGSIIVSSGTEDSSLIASLPHLVRFDSGLHEDKEFSTAASSLAASGLGQFYILGLRPDGGVIASLVEKGAGSRILFIGSKGQLLRETNVASLMAPLAASQPAK